MSEKYYNADAHIFYTESDHNTVVLRAATGQTLVVQGASDNGVPPLTSSHIFVGNSDNIATDQAMSGDATMDNTGNLSLITVTTAALCGGDNSIPTFNVDSKGRIVSHSSAIIDLTNLTMNSGTVLIGNSSNVSTPTVISGDATINNTGVLTLISTGVVPGTYGSTNYIPIFTVDHAGRVTATSGANVTLTGLPLNSANILVGNSTNTSSAISISGDASINNTGVLTLSTSGVTAATYGSTNNIPIFSVNAKGLITAVSTTSVSLTGLPLNSANILVGNSVNLSANVTMSGDGTLSNTGVLTLSSTTSGATVIPTSITYDSKGRITSTSNYLLQGNIITGSTANTSISIPVSGDLTQSIGVFTLNNTGVTAGTYSSPIITVNSKGLITSVSSGYTTNLLYNGGFQLYQRSIGSRSLSIAASTTAYTFDRWQIKTQTNQAAVVSSQNNTISGDYYCRVQRNSGQTGTGIMYFGQSLTRNMSVSAIGNVCTVSLIARAGGNFSPTSGTITVNLIYGTGTSDISGISGAFTGSSNAIQSNINLTTTFTSYSFTSSAIPSNATQLCLQIYWTPTGTAGTNDYFDISNVQLEVNSTASKFSYVDYQTELNRCKYFFQVVGAISGYGASTTVIQCPIPYNMRIAPTIGSVSPAGATNVVLTFADSATLYTQSSFSYSSFFVNNNGGSMGFSNLSGITQFRSYMLYDDSSPYNDITLTAELV